MNLSEGEEMTDGIENELRNYYTKFIELANLIKGCYDYLHLNESAHSKSVRSSFGLIRPPMVNSEKLPISGFSSSNSSLSYKSYLYKTGEAIEANYDDKIKNILDLLKVLVPN
mmetsp:Transcript_19478/g.18600  ORF Transcript_19478/g.18600 Transcript_19478/m.18600 type:complete len:113 (-) Transcript_19478:1485-1823(-)